VVALRDAGAHFITTFGATPDIAVWLDNIANGISQNDTIPTPESGDVPVPVPPKEADAPEVKANPTATAAQPDSVS
jgi:hypothetical protein